MKHLADYGMKKFLTLDKTRHNEHKKFMQLALFSKSKVLNFMKN